MNIFKRVGGWFSSAFSWVKGAFDKGSSSLLQYTGIAIKVVDAVKAVNNNSSVHSVIGAIVSITTTKIDDAAYLSVRKWLDANIEGLSNKLGLANSIVGIEDPNERLLAVIRYIKTLGVNERTEAYTELCARIVEHLSDGKYEWSEITADIKYIYDRRKELGIA